MKLMFIRPRGTIAASGRATHIRHGWVTIDLLGVRWWNTGTSAWVDRTPAALSTAAYTGLIWFSDSDVWVSDAAKVAHWDGSAWTTILDAGAGGYTVNGISGYSSSTVYVVATKTGTYHYTSGNSGGFAGWTSSGVTSTSHEGELWTGAQLWVSSPDTAVDLLSGSPALTPGSPYTALPDFRRRHDGQAWALGVKPLGYALWYTASGGTSWTQFIDQDDLWFDVLTDTLTMYAFASNPVIVSAPNDNSYWVVGQFHSGYDGHYNLPVWITNYNGVGTNFTFLSSSPLEEALLDIDVINGRNSGANDVWVCGYRVGDPTATPSPIPAKALIYHLSGSGAGTWTDRSITL